MESTTKGKQFVNGTKNLSNSEPTTDQQRNYVGDANGGAQHFLLSAVLNKRVKTKSGEALGKLRDLTFKDDPKYAEVTGLVVGRSFGHPSLNVPWEEVISISEEETVVKDPSSDEYPEFHREDEELLLRNKILDKRILDLEGFAVEVVYDMQLLLVEKKLFIVAADVSRPALMRRLGLGTVFQFVEGKGNVANEEQQNIIPWRYVQPLGTDLTETKGDLKLTVSKERLGEIHHEDIADILEELNQEERIHVFNALDSRVAANALEVTEPRVQREILAETSGERVREIFAHMSPVQIAEIISVLPYDDSGEFMKMLKEDVSLKVQQILTEHDATASLLATKRFLAFPGNLTMEQAFAKFRTEARNAIVTMYIYVVDENQKLRGVLDINELVQADPNSRLENIMIRNFVSVPPAANRAKVEALFRRYRFRAIPVVDDSGRIIGAVREKDVFLPE